MKEETEGETGEKKRGGELEEKSAIKRGRDWGGERDERGRKKVLRQDSNPK